MTARRHSALALIALFVCTGAQYRTSNFVVNAPTPQIAQQVGQWAEHYRKEKSVQWLGREMQPWPEPCPLYVTVSMNGPSGATSFNFGRDRLGNGLVMGQRMEIQGPLDRLIASVLPHEITHTVFAYHFKQPVPRWADEGGSVLSEDDIERDRHNKLVRHILNSGQQIRMRTLFGLKEYPANVMALYAQGYSISDFLVKRSDRQTFLNFVAHGLTQGWDNAVWTYYRHRSVEEMEEAWLQHLRDTKGQPHIEVAQNNRQPRIEVASTARAQDDAQTRGTVVRLTVPPPEARPAAIVRGQSGDSGQTFGGGRPQYLPDYQAPADPGWRPTASPPQPRYGYDDQPPAPQPQQQAPPRYAFERAQGQQQAPQGAPMVQLGPPQFNAGPQAITPAMENGVSPVGFPR